MAKAIINKEKVTFRVTAVEPAPEGKAPQIRMVGTNGTRLRFYPNPHLEWTIRAWVAGKISAKNLKFITDDWYVGEMKLTLKVGDVISVYEKVDINNLRKGIK